jgi:ABC-type transport system involved in cytochrome c biogenesis permease component
MIGVGIALYFLPTIIAFFRGHLSAWAIFALNLLLGWTALGWIVAIVWSLTGNTRKNAAALARGAPPPEGYRLVGSWNRRPPPRPPR